MSRSKSHEPVGLDTEDFIATYSSCTRSPYSQDLQYTEVKPRWMSAHAVGHITKE